MRTTMIRFAAGFGAALLLAGGVLGGRAALAGSNAGAPVQQSAPTGHTITVAGQGQVQLAPDMASLTLGVQTRANDAQAALSENATKMTAVIQAIENQGVAASHIQTSELSVYYDQQNASYYANNSVSVRIDDISKVGAVVDAAVAAGANNSWGVNFGFKDPSTGRSQALQAAVGDAQKRAQALATALGVSINGVGSVSETTYNTVPIYAAGKVAAPAAPTTPVQAGQLTVTADIQVVYTFG